VLVEPELVATAAGPVEVADLGAGPAVLIVHGMPGDWSQAAPLGRELARTHRVLLISRPGYGRTPLATGPTWDTTAAAYTALLDALDIERAAIVGISGGGPSSFTFAAQQRDRCAGLVLCCAVHPDVRQVPLAMRVFNALPGVVGALTRLARSRQLRAAGEPGALVARALEEANEVERARVEADPVAREWLVDFARHNLRVSADMRPFRHDLRQIVAHQRARAALVWPDGPAVPTLVLHGSVDPVVDLASAQAYRDLVPGAELVVYEGGGHGFLLTFRSETTPVLRRFLSQPHDGITAL